MSLIREAEEFEEFKEILDAGGTGLSKWLLRHPRWFVRLLRYYLQSDHRAESEASAEPEGMPPSRPQEVEDDDENLPTSTWLKNSVAKAQAISAIQGFIEARLYQPHYLQGEPYLRLHLRGVNVRWSILGGGGQRDDDVDGEGVAVDALLLVHRSGVVQLTLVARLPERISTRDISRLANSGNPLVSSLEMSEPLLSNAFSAEEQQQMMGEWASEIGAGVRWRRMDFPSGSEVSIASVFELYKQAIENLTGLTMADEWMNYPVLFLEKLDCCSSEDDWLKHHSRDLAALTLRGPEADQLRGSALNRPRDVSIIRSISKFMNSGSTAVVHWPGFRARGFEDNLWTVQVVESALLQYWQLRGIERRLANSQDRAKDVEALQREVVYGLSEFRSSRLAYGSATDDANALLEGWGAEKMYSRILESLDQLQQLVANEEARRSGRRAVIVSVAGALAAVLFGIPALSQGVDVIRSAGLGAPLMPDWVFALAAKYGNQGAWVLYIGFLGVVATLAVFTLWPHSRVKRDRSAGRAGDPWPYEPIVLINEESEPEAGSLPQSH